MLTSLDLRQRQNAMPPLGAMSGHGGHHQQQHLVKEEDLLTSVELDHQLGLSLGLTTEDLDLFEASCSAQSFGDASACAPLQSFSLLDPRSHSSFVDVSPPKSAAGLLPMASITNVCIYLRPMFSASEFMFASDTASVLTNVRHHSPRGGLKLMAFPLADLRANLTDPHLYLPMACSSHRPRIAGRSSGQQTGSAHRCGRLDNSNHKHNHRRNMGPQGQ